MSSSFSTPSLLCPSPSGRRLSPMDLIEMCKEKPAAIASSSKTRTVTPAKKMNNSNSDSVFATPRTVRQQISQPTRRRLRYDSDSPILTVGQIFTAHNAKQRQDQQQQQQQRVSPFSKGSFKNANCATLRRQQSASATMIGSGGKVYLQCKSAQSVAYNVGRPATAFATPPRSKS